MIDNIIKWTSIFAVGTVVAIGGLNLILDLYSGNTTTKVLGLAGGLSAIGGVLWGSMWAKVFGESSSERER